MEAVRCVGGVLELRVKEKQGKVHRWEVAVVVGWWRCCWRWWC